MLHGVGAFKPNRYAYINDVQLKIQAQEGQIVYVEDNKGPRAIYQSKENHANAYMCMM